MNLVISTTAQRQIANHIAYIQARNPDAAQRLYTALVAGMERLLDHPYMGRPGRVTGTRELYLDRTPYVVIYRVLDDQIAVAHVVHVRQQWPPESDA